MEITKTMNLEGIMPYQDGPNSSEHIIYSGYMDDDQFLDFVIVPFDSPQTVYYDQAQFIPGSTASNLNGAIQVKMPLDSNRKWELLDIDFSSSKYDSRTAGDIPESLTIYLKLESK